MGNKKIDIDEDIIKNNTTESSNYSKKEKHSHHHHHHGHSHHHHHHHHGSSSSNILFAFFINVVFSIIELIGGLYTGSIAIISDALHDFGDSISLGVAWRLQKISEKGGDSKYSYGYKRFKLLGALLISLILILGSISIIYNASQKFFEPSSPKADVMIVLAIIGLIANSWAAIRMSGAKSLSDRAVMLHMMEDVLGWAAVLVVSIVMYFVNAPWLDPLLSIFISIWILYNVYFTLKSTLKVILQGVPDGFEKETFLENLLNIKSVLSIHDFHLWTEDGEHHVSSIHIVLDNNTISDIAEINRVRKEVRELANKYDIYHITIEFDSQDYDCELKNCII